MRWHIKKLTKKELEDIKSSYHIGDDHYAPTIYVEKLVKEVERLWKKERSEKREAIECRKEERRLTRKWNKDHPDAD